MQASDSTCLIIYQFNPKRWFSLLIILTIYEIRTTSRKKRKKSQNLRCSQRSRLIHLYSTCVDIFQNLRRWCCWRPHGESKTCCNESKAGVIRTGGVIQARGRWSRDIHHRVTGQWHHERRTLKTSNLVKGTWDVCMVVKHLIKRGLRLEYLLTQPHLTKETKSFHFGLPLTKRIMMMMPLKGRCSLTIGLLLMVPLHLPGSNLLAYYDSPHWMALHFMQLPRVERSLNKDAPFLNLFKRDKSLIRRRAMKNWRKWEDSKKKRKYKRNNLIVHEYGLEARA